MKNGKNWLILMLQQSENVTCVSEVLYGEGLDVMEAARKLIGCDYVEAVQPRETFRFLEGTLILIDEEGKFKDGNRYNRIATMCSEIDPSDYIVGNAVIVKKIPEDFDFFAFENEADDIARKIMTRLKDWDL